MQLTERKLEILQALRKWAMKWSVNAVIVKLVFGGWNRGSATGPHWKSLEASLGSCGARIWVTSSLFGLSFCKTQQYARSMQQKVKVGISKCLCAIMTAMLAFNFKDLPYPMRYQVTDGRSGVSGVVMKCGDVSGQLLPRVVRWI